MKLVYKVTTGKPYKVRTLKYDIQDSKIKEYMRQDSAVTLLSEGMYLMSMYWMQNASASQTNCFRMDITSSIKSTYPILRILSVILIW